jgi:hypothetical protein
MEPGKANVTINGTINGTITGIGTGTIHLSPTLTKGTWGIQNWDLGP